jgi:hypothetical protein
MSCAVGVRSAGRRRRRSAHRLPRRGWRRLAGDELLYGRPLSVTVTCVDDAPAAVDDAATLTEDDPAAAIDVLANDSDVEVTCIAFML